MRFVTFQVLLDVLLKWPLLLHPLLNNLILSGIHHIRIQRAHTRFSESCLSLRVVEVAKYAVVPKPLPSSETKILRNRHFKQMGIVFVFYVALNIVDGLYDFI